MAKKRVLAGRVGEEKYYFDEKGDIVDKNGKPAPASIATAILAGVDSIPAKPPEPKRPTRKQRAASPPAGTGKGSLSDLSQKMQSTGGGEVQQDNTPLLRSLVGAVARGAGGIVGGAAKATGGMALGGMLKGFGIEELLPAGLITSALMGKGDGGGKSSRGGNQADTSKQIIESNEGIVEAIKTSNTILEDILVALDENQKAQIEASREAAAKRTGDIGNAGAGGPKAAGGWLGKILEFAKDLTFALGAVLGALTGYVKKFVQLGEFLGKGLMKGIRSIVGLFDKGGKLGEIGNLFTRFSKVFDSIIKPFRTAFTYLRRVFTSVGEFGSIITKVVPFLGDFVKIFKTAFKAFPVVGEILMVIEGIWDTVWGIIEGYKKGGIVGAIEGAFKGFFGSFIGGFLDTLKDLTSWVLDLFGFENASKWLDSFSFEEFINNFIDNVSNLVKGVGTAIADAVSAAWNFVTALPKKALGWIGDAVGSVSSTVKGWWDSLVGGATTGGLNDGGTTKLESTSNIKTTSEGDKVQTKGIVEQKSAFGSTGAGALITAKGKQSGGFTGVQATTTKTGESDLIELNGQRTSGGLFGADTYEIIDTKNNKSVQVAKGDYFDIQQLVADGKVREAYNKLQKIVEQQEAEKEASLRGDTVEYDAMGNVTGISSGSSMAMASKSSAQAAAASTPPAPVVVPVPTGGGGGGGTVPVPVPAGPVSTSPKSSQVDRMIYGNFAGVAP